MRWLLTPMVVLALVGRPIPTAAQAVDTAAAVGSLGDFDDACGRVGPIWPVDLCGPLVLVDPQTRTAVANRPDPEGVFTSSGRAYLGSWPDDMPIANTAVAWGDRQWAMVMLPLPEDRFRRLQLMAHEAFHRIQPELGHQVEDAMALHLDEEEGRLWLRMELRAWVRALASDGEEARAAAEDALLFRALRQEMFPGSAEIERRMEAHEGLAEYTGLRFALDATGADMDRAARGVAGFEHRPTYVRALGYGTGPALGLLLDRHEPDWRGALGPLPDLAGRLAAALGVPTLPTTDDPSSPDAARRQAEAYGFEEVRSEERERAARIATLRDRYRAELVEGAVLVLGLPERRLMFNPNTVLALGEEGNVYPGSILFGPWGRLTLDDAAALATHDRDMARVAAPSDPEPDEDGRVIGPGWTLELDPGWRLAPGARSGDYRLVRGDGAGAIF
jgi:hypothetical protein